MHFKIIVVLTSVMKHRHSASHRTNAIALYLWKLKVITQNSVLSKKWDICPLYTKAIQYYILFLNFGE